MRTIYLPRRLGQHLADAEALTAPRTWNSNSADSQARQKRHLEHNFALMLQLQQCDTQHRNCCKNMN